MQDIGNNRESTVFVLLSTYNGEKYLKEQLDSLFCQKGCQVQLLIRDDGSTDATKEIIRQYQNGLFRDRILLLEEGKNIGVIQSFFWLMHKAEELPYGYYALADQDDIWMPDKLLAALLALKSKEAGRGACLYTCALQPVDENGKELQAGIRYPKMRPAFGNALVENICTGCTCVMNRDMLLLLSGKTPKFTVMHDFWLYLLASAFGKIIYDKTPHVLYRQHGNNSVGMASTVFENYKRRVRNFKKHRGQLKCQAREFGRLYGDGLAKWDGEKAGLLQDFVMGGRGLAFDQRLYRQRRSDDLIMRCLLLAGWL